MTRKGSIHQEDITIISICAANLRAPKYTKQTLTELKGTDSNTVLVGDFNSPLSIMNARDRRWKGTQTTWTRVQTNSTWHIENTWQKQKIYVLLKYTWYILQDRPQVGQNKPQQIKDLNHTKYLILTATENNYKSTVQGKLENSQICGKYTTQLWIANESKKKSQRKLENILRQMNIKTQDIKIYEM